MIKRILFLALLISNISHSTAFTNTGDIPIKFGGIYKANNGQKYLVNPSPSFPHFVVMETGETHMMRALSDNLFEFSETRNNWDSTGGTIEFRQEGVSNEFKFCITHVDGAQNCANSIKLTRDKLTLNLSDSLVISGELINRPDSSKDLVAVLLHGDGINDRYDLYTIAMYLVDTGYAVFAYDKRNAGKSKGPEVYGDSYDEISRIYASDATIIIQNLQEKFPNKKFGVVGISQGGWIGSIVSSQIPELAFYVNIAGSISTGWEQWRHYMLSYLKRNGFNDGEVKEAEDYLQVFFAVGLGETSFEEYNNKLKLYEEKPWFKGLAHRKLIKWIDKDQAVIVLARNSNEPIFDVQKVNCPTLGIFYEFDHSTPEDSPILFLQGLQESRSKDYCVRIFPNSTHGGWVVENYYFDTGQIRYQNAEALKFIPAWLDSL